VIAVLDAYFEGVCAIVTRHGGMVDKLVGDAVHAFFNMPFDVSSHADRAIACAIEIDTWTRGHRAAGLAERMRLGRTRIGVESGDAVVGDVGPASKLDYTAHGSVVNTAARLEGLNKEFGTAICVGPVAASIAKTGCLRSLAVADVRGIGVIEVFTPVEDQRSRRID
jgi:adenylate cyclase